MRPGFKPQSVMVVRTWLPVPNDPAADVNGTAAQEAPLLREILRRGRTLLGVEEVAIGDMAAVPLGHSWRDLNPYPLMLEGRDAQGGKTPFVNRSTVTPEYFHLLGMSLLRGRLFNESDNDKAPQSAVIKPQRTWKYALEPGKTTGTQPTEEFRAGSMFDYATNQEIGHRCSAVRAPSRTNVVSVAM